MKQIQSAQKLSVVWRIILVAALTALPHLARSEAPVTIPPSPEQKATPHVVRSYYATSVMIPMRDGVQLAANLVTPGDGKPAPVIISITPYERHGAHWLAASYASQGLAFLAVDTRGRGDSEGKFEMFYSDLNDTIDVIAWAASQPFSNGKSGMWGSSYGGYNQWMAAARQAPALTTITPGASVYPGWDFPMTNYVGYPYSSKWPAFTKGRMSNRSLFTDPKYWNEAFADALARGVAFKDIDKFVGFDTDLFDEWVAHPSYDSYWAGINPSKQEMEKIDIPILSMTGLYDGAQLGALRYYKEHMALASKNSRSKHYMIIGPYDHTGVVFPRPEVGGLEVPNSGGLAPTELHAQWYKWTMDDGPKPPFLKDKFIYYVMGDGANEWRFAASINDIPVNKLTFSLSTSDKGAPTSVARAGILSPDHQGDDTIAYVFDPTDTSKAALGGWYEGDFISYDKDILAIDGDGFVFETEPFETPMEIIGQPEFEAYIGINTPDADFRLRIYEILPDGKSVYLSQARMRARYRESTAQEHFIDTITPLRYWFDTFLFASRRLQKGSKLRFVFDPPNSIHIQRNYNAAKPVAEQVPADALTSTVTMVIGGKNAAQLTLPLKTVTEE